MKNKKHTYDINHIHTNKKNSLQQTYTLNTYIDHMFQKQLK